MSRTIDKFQADADRLAEGFLITECIWDPTDDGSNDGETLHPELLRHLIREAVERGDFTFRYWRDDFYRWEAGLYVRVSDSDMKSWLVHHQQGHDRQTGMFFGCHRCHV
ncbi:MAG TPA: hypothetical protein DIU00_03430 [Phycisphaerales bacterium]|nr:hypothetical protein [Phycisphaerales bacterium]